jgi:hypothetical protein
MSDMVRKCGACEGLVSPHEVHRIAGLPLVHRYRCSCSTHFDVATSLGRGLLVALNAFIVGFVALAPASKFKSSDDRLYILLVLLGVQVPVVAFVVWRSVQNDRRHPLVASRA